MALRLSANQIATEALRKIGELSPRDQTAGAGVLDISLRWLDIEVAHLCGTNPIDWMVPEALSFPLLAGTVEYTLGADDTASTRPEYGLEFLIQAMLVDGNGNRDAVEIISFTEYEALATHGDAGLTTQIAYNRRTGKIYLDVVPSAVDADVSTATNYTLELLFQEFAPDLYSKSQSKQFLLRAAWQKWAIHACAYSIGTGPVRHLPASETDRIKADRDLALNELLAFENDTRGRDKRVSYHQPM